MSLLPMWVARRINPISFLVGDFLALESKGIPASSVVLDAGAGECQYAGLFSHCKYISLDFAKGDPKWNYKRLSVIGNLLFMPIRDKSVDAVICTQTLEHVNEPDILLREIFRVLTPGGRLYLTAPFGTPMHQPPYDFLRFSYYGLEHLLSKTGFDIEFIRPQGGYFLYLANCVLHMHRVLFPAERPLLKKILFSPLQFLVALFATILLPLFLYFLDGLDTKRNFTLNYECRCRKG